MTPRWVPWTTFTLAAAAVAVSSYLTVAHYTSPDLLACVENGLVNCARVTTSAQSRFLGIPVAVIGLGWSLATAVLCHPIAWRSRSTWIGYARLALAFAGIGFVLWLVYAELFVVRAICLWCTAIHVLTFALFVVIAMYGWPQPQTDRRSRR